MKRKRRKPVVAICLLLMVLLIGTGIVVYYKTQYFLVLNGEEEVQVNLCQAYDDPGVSAKKGGIDVSNQVKVDSNLNLQVPGRYVISYTLEDLIVYRYVTVVSTMDPVLELKGKDDFYLNLGETFEEPGFTAHDKNGKNLTQKVKVDTPDFKKAGKAEVTYTVSDSTGKTTKVTRQVCVLPNTQYETSGLPICMYHYVYDPSNPPEDLSSRYGNYIKVSELEEELAWLKAEGYYFPTWQEVRDYVDGQVLLPEKSIVLCFDDGAKSFLKNGIPLLEKYQVPATCFMITADTGAQKVKDYPSDYVTYESHSDNMHRGGGNFGHGGIFVVMPREEALADLATSIKKCGSGDAFAYPYGDYTQECRDIVEEAGFLCAVTTEFGKAKPGMDPMLLPRVRMSNGQSLASFQSMVAPEN